MIPTLPGAFILSVMKSWRHRFLLWVLNIWFSAWRLASLTNIMKKMGQVAREELSNTSRCIT